MKLSELLNVLKTAETVEEMDMRREEIAALIPAVRTMFGYDQKNSAHQYDLDAFPPCGLQSSAEDGK